MDDYQGMVAYTLVDQEKARQERITHKKQSGPFSATNNLEIDDETSPPKRTAAEKGINLDIVGFPSGRFGPTPSGNSPTYYTVTDKGQLFERKRIADPFSGPWRHVSVVNCRFILTEAISDGYCAPYEFDQLAELVGRNARSFLLWGNIQEYAA